MRVLAAIALAGLAFASPLANAAPPSPSLEGVWWIDKHEDALKPLSMDKVPLTAEGRRQYEANKAVLAEMAAKPRDRNDLRACLPLGPTRILEEPFPLQIVETPTDVILMWEHNHVYETVYLNAKQNPDEDWAYMGNSVGVKTKDGLTISTQAFNDQTYLDNTGLPHTDQLKLVRKLRLGGDGKTLEITSTITDPSFYTKSWSVRHILTLRPEESLQEYVCGQGPVLETRYTRTKQG